MATVAAVAAGSNQFGLDAELFTRGAKVDGDRGESMVHKHMEKLQQEKETQALQDLGKLMPQIGLAVRVMALKEANGNLDHAMGYLRGFSAEFSEQLAKLQKKRRKVESAEEEAVKRAEQERADEENRRARDAAHSSGSSSDDSSDSIDYSGSDSWSDSDRGKKRKRGSSSKKRRSKDKKRSSKKSSRDKKRSSKKRSKSDSDDKARAKTGATNTENFGRFGLLRESDMHTKHAEFTLWAIEVKKTNTELLGRLEEKELFKDFMEDFNTGTLPHRKYYNLDIYQREKAAKAAKKGLKTAEANKKNFALNDEEALRRAREEERIKAAEERRRRDLAELQLTGKAKDMREQELLRLQMQAAYKTGDRAKAAVLQKQLMTDEEKMAKGIIKWKPKI